MGTAHMGVGALPPSLVIAAAGCTRLIIECHAVDPLEEELAEMKELVRRGDGPHLFEIFGEDLVREAMAVVGGDWGDVQLAKMSPIGMSWAMLQEFLQREEMAKVPGTEHHLVALFHEKGRTSEDEVMILSLETLSEQMQKLLGGLRTPEDLRVSIDGWKLSQGGHQVADTLSDFEAGTIQDFCDKTAEKLSVDHRRQWDYVMDGRSDEWTPTIISILSQGVPTMVAVGAGHVARLVANLRANGIEVEPAE